MSMNPEMEPLVTTCGNCHSPMPRELRFCRNCGYRLGEGSAEYTETVRFQDGAYVGPAGNGMNAFGASSGQMSTVASGAICRRKKRFSGISWIFIAVVLFFMIGGIASFF